MADIQVVFMRELIPIDGVNLISLDPPILIVYGRSFNTASEVRVNGNSAEFYVNGDKTLLAAVPEGLLPTSVDTVEVFSSTPATDVENVRLDFLLSRRPFTVSGIQRLVQAFLKRLFTTPKTNIYNRNEGGGALQILGMVDGEEATRVSMAFSTAVDRTRKQMQALQSKTRIPSSERLLEASLVRSAFDPQKGALQATIILESFAREQAAANITV